MNTGCQPPFCHGTGGFCGCNCKCCPPPCCPCIMVYFQCCPPSTLALAVSPGEFDAPATTWDNLPLEIPIPELPDFNSKPIFSIDGRFTLGFGSVPSTCPCETICVEIKCGGNMMPCCCLELLNGIIYSVGNGYVTAPTTVIIPGCGVATVYINGLPPPVFVNDCEEIIVTLVVNSPCCATECQQVNAVCTPCGILAMTKAPIWKRKVDSRTGKTKINPNTGKPIIVINKKELMKRILNRIKKSKRRS